MAYLHVEDDTWNRVSTFAKQMEILSKRSWEEKLNFLLNE